MRRQLLPLLPLVFLVAACSQPAGEPTTTAPRDDAVSTSTAPGPLTTESGEDTSTSAPGATTTTSDRPMAPDFTLELGDGGTYTLSEGAKPVYLVFWAEW